MSRSINIIICIALFMAATCGLSCKKDKTSKLVVHVIKKTVDGDVNIVGADVRVHCDTAINKGCIIDETKLTDFFGQVSFKYKLEALLIIEVKSDTMKGEGIADLKSGTTIRVKVELN